MKWRLKLPVSRKLNNTVPQLLKFSLNSLVLSMSNSVKSNHLVYYGTLHYQ